MPRAAPIERTPLGRELQKRARYGAKWSTKANAAFELAVVSDPAGASSRDRADAFETLLRRVPKALRDGDFSYSRDLLYGTDMNERAHVIEALFELHVRWARKPLSVRRVEICGSVLEGRLAPASFRARYELELYEVVAAVMRYLDQQYRERTGRTEEPKRDQDEVRLVEELATVLVPVARVYLYVQTFIGTNASVQFMDDALGVLEEEGALNFDPAEIKKDAEGDLTVGEMQQKYGALALVRLAETNQELLGEAVVNSLWFWGLLLVDLHDLYWRLETWEGPGAWDAGKAAGHLKVLSEPPLREGANTASTLAYHARSREFAPVMEYLQTEPGQQVLADWHAFLQSCTCLDPASMERGEAFEHEEGCSVGHFARAAYSVLEYAVARVEAIPAPVAAQLENVQPESVPSRAVWGSLRRLDESSPAD